MLFQLFSMNGQGFILFLHNNQYFVKYFPGNCNKKSAEKRSSKSIKPDRHIDEVLEPNETGTSREQGTRAGPAAQIKDLFSLYLYILRHA